jgi:hydroxypyruvate isomerase
MCYRSCLLSGDQVQEMPREVQHQCCIDTLKAAADLVQGKSINSEPVQLLLEAIDPEENPRYFLTGISEALEVVQAIGHPQVRLLYDLYHEQIAAGNLIENLEKACRIWDSCTSRTFQAVTSRERAKSTTKAFFANQPS